MPLLRRRPLLRAAAVGGGAYYAGKRASRSQQREADQEARLEALEAQPQSTAPVASAPAPAPAVSAAGGGLSQATVDQLKQLGQLHEQGVLTDEEFAAQKRRLLGS